MAIPRKMTGRVSWESRSEIIPLVLQDHVVVIVPSKRKGVEKTEQEVKPGPFWKLKLSLLTQEINVFLIMMAEGCE